jgi:peptidoglycan/LPS O-acetylase OafA/YrhL
MIVSSPHSVAPGNLFSRADSVRSLSGDAPLERQMPAQKGRFIRPLAGLRGVAILSVVLLHFGSYICALLPSLTDWLSLSARAVFRMDLFFMLSGFMAAYVFIKPGERLRLPEYRWFLLNRLIRLFPAYLAAFLALASGVAIARLLHLPLKGNYSLEAVPIRLALLHAWPFMSWSTWAWNYPTWFLSSLWFAYVFVFPLSWWLVRRLHGSRWAFTWLFCPLVLWLTVSHLKKDSEFHLVLRVSCEFSAGFALYVLYASKARFIAVAQRYLDLTVLGFLVALVSISTVPSLVAPQVINAALVLGTPFLLAGMTAETSVSARLMTSRPLLWLGGLSYALFLSHGVVQKFLTVALPAQRFTHSSLAVRCLVLLAYAAAVLGAATALHKWVEMPSSKALKHWFARERDLREIKASRGGRGVSR